MAGHSKFKNIMFRKGAQDKKRASLFAKLAREITTAAKLGGDNPQFNSRLRLAIQSAKSSSMPRENIDRAIKKSDDNKEAFEEMRYEGYGPGGVAVIVDCLSDNRNRTVSDIRTAFAKSGGSLGSEGSVSFLFSREGQIIYPAEGLDDGTLLEAAIEAGANDVLSNQDGHEILCDADQLHRVAAALESSVGPPATVAMVWRPLNAVAVDEDKAPQLLRLLNTLEDHDDVQSVAANFDISDDLLEQLAPL